MPPRQLGVEELHLALRCAPERRHLAEREAHQRDLVAQEDQDGHARRPM